MGRKPQQTSRPPPCYTLAKQILYRPCCLPRSLCLSECHLCFFLLSFWFYIHVCVCVAATRRRGDWIPWSWCDKWLLAAQCVLGTELGPSQGAECVLSCGVISAAFFVFAQEAASARYTSCQCRHLTCLHFLAAFSPALFEQSKRFLFPVHACLC